MFHDAGGCFSTKRTLTMDLMLLKPYFHGTTTRIGAPFCAGKTSPYKTHREDRQRMHRFVHAQSFDVGPFHDRQSSGPGMRLGSLQGDELDKLGVAGGLGEFDQRA